MNGGETLTENYYLEYVQIYDNHKEYPAWNKYEPNTKTPRLGGWVMFSPGQFVIGRDDNPITK